MAMGTGEKAQWWRLTALLRGPSSVPAFMWYLSTTVSLQFQGINRPVASSRATAIGEHTGFLKVN